MSQRTTNRRPKRRAPWAAYLWPGLPHLWVRGSWAGLALAVGFTALLHTTVLATLVWPEWLSPRVVIGCGVTLGLLWVAALIETRGELRRLAAEKQAGQHQDNQADHEPTAATEPTADPLDALLIEAQTHYLRADWVATERKLLELLRLDGEDPEAQLLLATLWRRTGRESDARRRLRRLARREAAAGWGFEIEAELRLCEPQAAAPTEQGPPDEQPDDQPSAGPTPTQQPPTPADATPNEGPPAEPLQLADTAQPQPEGTDRRAA